MAAESAVLVAIGTSLASALLKPVMKKCSDALSNTNEAAGLKSAILGNLKPKLGELKRELIKLDALLSHAESLNPVQHTRNDLLILWLKRVKEAANFADNLLDDISYDQLRRQAESNPVAQLFSGSDGTSFAFRMKIGSELNKFKSMAADIYKEAAEIGVRPAELLANPASYQPPAAMSTDLREIRENVDTSTIVGRQSDEELIVHELCRPNNHLSLGLIAMVGMSAEQRRENRTGRRRAKSEGGGTTLLGGGISAEERTTNDGGLCEQRSRDGASGEGQSRGRRSDSERFGVIQSDSE